MRFGQAIGWGAGLVLFANVAWAQQTGRHGRDDERTRYLRELVQQAQSAQAAGNHQGALDLALQVERFSVNPSILMFIAEEYQALYRPAESRDYAERCVQSVQATRFALDDREAILQRCRELQSAGENGFGSVRLVLPEDAPAELRVFVAGRQVTREECREPRTAPVGEVEIEATAPGYLVWRQRVTVRSREVSETQVQLVAVPVCRDGGCAQTPPGGRTPELYRPSRTGPVTLMVTGGVLLLAAGAVVAFGTIPAQEAHSACYNDTPMGMTCPRNTLANTQQSNIRLRELSEEGTRYQLMQNLFLGAGIGVAVSGLVWFFVARPHTLSSAPPRASVVIQPFAEAGGLMVQIGGRL